jgi:hypothetical protein
MSLAGGTTWYVLHAGRAVAALPACDSSAATRTSIAALAADRARCSRPGDQVAGMLLLAAWFRKHPQERQRPLPVAADAIPPSR